MRESRALITPFLPSVSLLLTVSVFASAQGLGDAAKREQERRSGSPRQTGTGKTYTEADVAGLAPLANDPAEAHRAATPSAPARPTPAPAPTPVPTPSTSPAPRPVPAPTPRPSPVTTPRPQVRPSGSKATGTPAASRTAASGGRSDGDTRPKSDEEQWRSRVAKARSRVAKARDDHAFLVNLHIVPGMVLVDDDGKPVIESVEKLQSLTARAKVELEAAQKALDDLLEQARRAGVPATWLG